MTPAEIVLQLTDQLAGGVDGIPRILTDATGLDGAATSLRKEGRAVDASVGHVQHVWTALPEAVEAPGAIDSLHTAMDRPARLAHHLRGSSDALAAVLHDYAEKVAQAKKTFAELADTARQILRAAQAEGDVSRAAPRSTPPEKEASSGLVQWMNAFQTMLSGANDAWLDAQTDVLTRLQTVRNGLDPQLLIGSTSESTTGLGGPTDRYPVDGMTRPGDGLTPTALDGMMLGAMWLGGMDPHNLVFDGSSHFTKQIAQDPTLAAARRAARIQLAGGAWEYGKALDVDGRSVGGPSGLLTFARDIGTAQLYAETLGGVDGGVDESFLGSYGLAMVPIASAGAGRTVVRITVTNTTTLASGIRAPVVGYQDWYTPIAQAENTVTATGPASEQTQTLTWTEVISWPRGTSVRRTK